MAEYKYISLKDILENQSNPKLKLREPKVESKEQPDSHLVSKMLRNPKFPSSPPPSPFSALSSCSDIRESSFERTIGKGDGKKQKIGAKKKGMCTRLSSLKHSRSDDPLVYLEFGKDASPFIPDDDLNIFSQEMMNFSWEERTLKSKKNSESEEEEEKEKK